MQRTYIAIDLKSYYASVECMERGLDPMTTNLVVADLSRTEKTICLAVSPSLKAYGIPGRARLFEVVERVKEVNAERQRKAGGNLFEKSCDARELAADPLRAVGYLVAPPQMAKYIQISTQIYNVYLKYIAPEDIHVYSIDEVMMDVTSYLETYNMTARELAKAMILDVLRTTGITATAGIGTNLYLCKVAMDIMAKHVAPDEDGVRIAELDEMSYRRQLWEHRPLTDFWRVGRGYAKKLEAIGIYTMGDIAKCSIGRPNEYCNEELLYQMFGINAELLIDHAWGWEPCRMQDIKAYRPETNSISSGQVLQCPYPYDKARLVVREMAEAVAMDLLEKRLVTDQLTLTVGYDIENTAGGNFRGEIVTDRYGRKIPKHTHGTMNLPRKTSSARSIMDAVLGIYDEKVNPKLSVRRITITANKIVSEDDVPQKDEVPVQFNLFDDIAAQEQQRKNEENRLAQDPGSDAGHQEKIRQERDSERRELFRRRDRPRAQRADRRAQGMSGKYGDIINLPHPTSLNHPRMSLHDRAAQFSPFAALTGHHAAIAETGRLTDQRIELDESEIARVDAALQHLQELLPERPTVSITYFVPDERKSGGSYQTVTGEVKRIDAVSGMIQMTDRREIPIEDVFSIKIKI